MSSQKVPGIFEIDLWLEGLAGDSPRSVEVSKEEEKRSLQQPSVFKTILKQDIEFTIYGKMSNILLLSYPNKTGSSLKSHNILKTTISNS